MKYAFALSCTSGYRFGMISAMNAMAEFGTKADWEVAYDNIPEDYRKKVSNAFPFKVNWTPIQDLNAGVNKIANRHWHATWLITAKVIDNYDAVCLTQADHMPLSNMTALFTAAAKSDVLVITEHFNYAGTLEDLYKRTEPVPSRMHNSLTDQFIFANKKYKNIFSEVARLMDSKIEGHADKHHPVILLNNMVKKYANFDDVITLERHVWAWQHLVHKMKLKRVGDYIYNDRKIRLRGIHNRWWQSGRAAAELKFEAKVGNMSITRHNFNLIRNYMADFNAKRPEIMIKDYEKTVW